ncbi:MAG: hypothetical protein C0613_06360 [Desulfobulbaceae bacterium]|nr:MAG: hypothetical protein C0613_06360 [Desulfobulbaceae bacterium]
MSHQPEAILEDNLVKQLGSLGYSQVEIRDEESLLANLRHQLGAFNNTTFSERELAAKCNEHLEKMGVTL